ncbi:hypothetical protein LJ707_07295 [Mucilaginibacter sp. UR6-1]|uniref:hypothetical protein n=1 Tax=Mucilaginibacter sp. UR6-1 TaxID=1435643 RepID=UPI001E53C775|nr:hypothetical protein [Mucilaginibacter sp. UR6-1]MCC8408728.1 hypothetical protein [Mucilaginibacter sp. UR6-1]
MKNIALSVFGFIVLLMIGCSGSDTYQGKWKGMSPAGDKVQITFEPKKFTITDSTNKAKTYSYTQNSVSIKNGVETYGIKLDDGRGYQVHFPVARNESIGLIIADNGNVLYSISRKDYIKSEDIYSLK